MTHSLRSLMIVVTLACVLTSPISSEETKPDAPKAIVPNSEPHWLASEKLTKTLIDDGSDRCVSSAEDVVAIHAAWRRMDKFLQRRKDDSKTQRTVEESPEYVLGFMEARLLVTCPEWWRDAVLSATVDNTRRLVFVIPEERGERVAHGKIKWAVGTKVTTRGIKGQELMQIVRGDHSVEAPLQIIIDEGHGAVSAEYTTIKESVYFAFCPPSSSVSLLRIDNKNKKWSQILRGEWFVRSFYGPGSVQRAEIVVSKERIFVFAGDKSVIYFEVFDATDGTRLSRFSSRAYDIEPTRQR